MSRFSTTTDHVANLTDVIMRALPAVNAAVVRHRTGSCAYCTDAGHHRDCPALELTAATLDMIICCWHVRRLLQQEPERSATRA